MRALLLTSLMAALTFCCNAQVIGTDSALPWATAGEAYSFTLSVSGGAPPYTWSLASGALPPGIGLAPTGVLSGVPGVTGSFNFTARVSDSSGQSANKQFSLVVVLPQTPTISFTGLADTLSPAQQPEFDIQLSSTYPREITGSVTLMFEPDAVNSADDPAVHFSNGSRTLNFTIPAGQTKSAWASLPALQTGTVAGKLKLRLQYGSGGLNLTPLFPPVRTLTIARALPQIESVQVVTNSGGFNIATTGYSTPREITQASFEFSYTLNGEARTATVVVPLTTSFNTWYTSEPSIPFGSAFLYTQPFTVSGGSASMTSVKVTLTNSAGTSDAETANF